MNTSFTTEQFCSICLETYKESTGHDAVRLGCQHAFGRKCIQTWASQSTKCPACRSIFSPASLWSDENIPQSLADRLVATLREKRSALYSGLRIGFIAYTCIAALTMDPIQLLMLFFMAVTGSMALTQAAFP